MSINFISVPVSFPHRNSIVVFHGKKYVTLYEYLYLFVDSQ